MGNQKGYVPWNKGGKMPPMRSRKGCPNKNPYPGHLRIQKVCQNGHEKTTGLAGRCTLCAQSRARQFLWKRQGIFNPDGTQFSHVDFDRAYQIQQGKCLGCKRHQSELKGRLNADHDHATGVFRRLLCGSCNRLCGLANDNPTTLRNLADLLEVK